MKKFQFSLETVLDYKQQVLDALKVEHGAILAQVRRQEEVLAQVEARYASTNKEYREAKMRGLTIADAMSYDMGLRVLEEEIRREIQKLEALRRQEEEKRAQLVESKVEAASIELLKEKKQVSYNQALQKSEEQFIDELVSASWASRTSVAL